MTYRIEGLNPDQFRPLFALDEDELARRLAVRTLAGAGGDPCRVSLEDAEEGETLVLTNHVSHDVQTPFRATFGIYVREQATAAASFDDQMPPMLDRRMLSLRGFDDRGMLRQAGLAMPGKGDRAVRAMLAAPEIETIHAHNAAYGCFLAKIERG